MRPALASSWRHAGARGPTLLTAAIGLIGLLASAAAAPPPAPIRLSGHYEWRTDASSRSLRGDAVCFIPDAPSATRLPRRPGDPRLAWFCFSNRDRAAQLLALPAVAPGCGVSGPVTVRVSGYRVDPREGDVHDTARLLWARPGVDTAVLPCRD